MVTLKRVEKRLEAAEKWMKEFEKKHWTQSNSG